MAYEVTLVHVQATAIASQRRQVAWAVLPKAIAGSFDSIYRFLKANPQVIKQGHNVCVYHSTTPASVDLEVGVQVAIGFEDKAGVKSSKTPIGRAARTMHVGDYALLPKAHQAVHAWCASRGEKLSGVSWEIYGDWHDDPAQRKTEVFCLL